METYFKGKKQSEAWINGKKCSEIWKAGKKIFDSAIPVPTDYFSYWKFAGNLNNERPAYGNLIVGDGRGSSWAVGRKGLINECVNSNGTRYEKGTPPFGTKKVSFSFWIKPNTINNHYSIYSIGTVVNKEFNIILNKTGIGTVDVEQFSNDLTLKNFTSCNGLSTDWQNITVVIDRDLGSNCTKIYINGVEKVTTQSFSDNLSASNFPNKIQEFLGRYNEVPQYYKGLFQQFRIFKRVLSQQEIISITNE